MLSSYPVSCPHTDCDWIGNLMPSQVRGGPDAEILSMHRAWYYCPRCKRDLEVRIEDDRVIVIPAPVDTTESFRQDFLHGATKGGTDRRDTGGDSSRRLRRNGMT